MVIRKCNICHRKLELTVENFRQRPTVKTWFKSICLECERAVNKEKLTQRISWEKSIQEEKAYHLKCQEKERIYKAEKLRKKKLSMINGLTAKQWETIKQDFNNKCAYCGEEKPLAHEHFIPIYNKGEYTINNIIPSCKACNTSKFSNKFEDWYPNYKYYSKERAKFILKYLRYKDGMQQIIFF